MITPLFITLVFYIIIQFNHHQFERNLKQIAQTLKEQKTTFLKAKVDNLSELINKQQTLTKQILKEKVKTRVDVAYAIASNIYLQNRDNHTSHEVQKMIIDALRPLVWNQGESFIFILNLNGVFQLAPEYLKDKEGHSIIDFQDATKRFVIREEIDLVNKKGEGYLWDTFTRQGYPKKQQFKQLAYVKGFKSYDWYMGSAEYLDTTQKERIKNMLDILNTFPTNKSEYFFIIDKQGNVIKYTQNSHLEGKNVFTLTDTHGKRFIEKIIQQTNKNNSSFLNYQWKDPESGTVDTKYTYVRTIPHTNWILGSGFYQNNLDNEIEKRRETLTKAYQVELKQILGISTLLILISFIFSYIVSRLLYKRFQHFTHTIQESNDELTELNHTLEQKVNARTQELDNAYTEMKEIASTDALTSIRNRYFFDTALKQEIEDSNAKQRSFALLVFDLDHFKLINDTYGHDVGDVVLKELVLKVKESIGTDDIFARVGGEEFMIILHDTDATTARNLSEKIRKSIEETNFSHVKNVTISIGFTIYIQNETQEPLLKRVDEALYKAKANGRNRTEGDEN